jgi:ADP-ribose pyrophosphatase YjhB (NUDIX family)
MARRPRLRRIAAAIIERHDKHFLIARSKEEAERVWLFPRGIVRDDESAEAGMRRIAREDIGLMIEIVVGQPPLEVESGGERFEIRYFFCGLIHGDARPGPYAEVRWVSRAHLQEYDFDGASKPVVEWMVQNEE